MNRATARRTLPLLAQPAFVIIVIIATVHVIRAKPAEAIVTYAVAAALGIENVLVRRRPDTRPASGVTALGTQRPPTELVAVSVAAAALGWLASRWALYDWPLKIVTAVPGVLVAMLVFTRHPPESDAVPARPGRSGWLWAAVGVAVCLQELASFVQQPDPQTGTYEHPTLSFLVEPVLSDSPVARGCLLAVSLVGGYYLVRRAGLVVGRDEQPRFTRLGVPTLGTVTTWVMRRRAGQVGLLLAWWWLGWHFLAG